MSVGLILDEMPAGCLTCPLCHCSVNYNAWMCGAAKLEMAAKRGAYERRDDCPLQEVEPVRYAEWLYFDEYDDLRRCSECDYVVKAENISQYCPHCGAKMDGGAE